jgi:hypothetical protein
VALRADVKAVLVEQSSAPTGATDVRLALHVSRRSTAIKVARPINFAKTSADCCCVNQRPPITATKQVDGIQGSRRIGDSSASVQAYRTQRSIHRFQRSRCRKNAATDLAANLFEKCADVFPTVLDFQFHGAIAKNRRRLQVPPGKIRNYLRSGTADVARLVAVEVGRNWIP